MCIRDSRFHFLQMFFSRDAELKAFRLLAKRGLGPKLLATFEDGRVEEFLTGRVSIAPYCTVLYCMYLRKHAVIGRCCRASSWSISWGQQFIHSRIGAPFVAS